MYQNLFFQQTKYKKEGQILMNIFNEIDHRPYPLPSQNWIMRQTWRNLLFLHWPIPVEKLRPFIPASLKIDTFRGSAWLGVILFVIEGIYPRAVSTLSLVRKFPEINLRTYVKCKDKPGIYFLSIDVGNWASLRLAKRWYRLPYHSAKISFKKEGSSFSCQSNRKGRADIPIIFQGKYAPQSNVFFPKEGTVEHWLTERYCLYSTNNGVDIYCAEVHHRPWPLQAALAEISANTLFTPFDFDLYEEKPLAHYSKGIDSLIFNSKRIRIL